MPAAPAVANRATRTVRLKDSLIHEKVIRVPVFRYEVPAPSGTSVSFFEPEYVAPLIIEQFRTRWRNNPACKPVRHACPADHPQYRDITSIEQEHERLGTFFGPADEADKMVDKHYPGNRLWDEIKRVGEFVTRQTNDLDVSVYLEDTVEEIPAEATPYDLVDLGNPVDLEDLDADESVELETPESIEAKAKLERFKADKVKAREARELAIKRRQEKDAKAAAERARIAAKLSKGAGEIAETEFVDRKARRAEQSEDLDPAEDGKVIEEI